MAIQSLKIGVDVLNTVILSKIEYKISIEHDEDMIA